MNYKLYQHYSVLIKFVIQFAMQGMCYMYMANYSAQLHPRFTFGRNEKHYSIERGRVFNCYAREARPELHIVLDVNIQHKMIFLL